MVKSTRQHKTAKKQLTTIAWLSSTPQSIVYSRGRWPLRTWRTLQHLWYMIKLLMSSTFFFPVLGTEPRSLWILSISSISDN